MYPLTQKVTLTEFAARYNWLPMTALGLNVLVDFVNTGSLTYLLWKQKPETMLLVSRPKSCYPGLVSYPYREARPSWSTGSYCGL